MADSSYYDLLGVGKDASADEIKKAFRHKARQCHPDVSDAPDAEDQFKKLNEAYDALSDPRKRAQYDQFGTVSNNNGFGGYGAGSGGFQYVDLNDLFGGGGMDIGDLFSAFMGGTRARGGRSVRKEGRDMAMRIGLTLEDAARGVTRDITVDRLAPCEDCHATGSADSTGAQTCPDCRGVGQKTSFQRTFLGTMQTSVPCPKCQGTGNHIPHPCPECEGSGRVIDRQQVAVDVPAGIADGQQIRMRGMGEAGIRGAASGDLIITAQIASHKRFERSGADLHMVLPLTFTQASLGATKRVQGLLDEVTVDIPAGVQTGEKVKVVGAGMPILNQSTRGNLYCHIEVVVPRKLSAKQKELLSALSVEFGDSETSQVDHHRSGFDKVKDWFTG